MKKQKAPIVPILLVIILLGWIGYSQLPKSPPKPPEQPKDTTKSEGASVSKQFDQTPKPPVKPELRMVLNSCLLKVDPAVLKPKPNPTSTASQWYQPGADQTTG